MSMLAKGSRLTDATELKGELTRLRALSISFCLRMYCVRSESPLFVPLSSRMKASFAMAVHNGSPVRITIIFGIK
jgi:hypothetical protein